MECSWLGLLVAAAVGGAALGGLGVDAGRRRSGSTCGTWFERAPEQVVPDRCGLFILESIFAVAHVAVGQPPCMNARVLRRPVSGFSMAQKRGRRLPMIAKHQPVARRQIPRPLRARESPCTLGWPTPCRNCPAFVQLHHVAARSAEIWDLPH